MRAVLQLLFGTYLCGAVSVRKGLAKPLHPVREQGEPYFKALSRGSPVRKAAPRTIWGTDPIATTGRWRDNPSTLPSASPYQRSKEGTVAGIVEYRA